MRKLPEDDFPTGFFFAKIHLAFRCEPAHIKSRLFLRDNVKDKPRGYLSGVNHIHLNIVELKFNCAILLK